MGGIVGKLFREFAVTLSVAIAVSLLVSLTTTPMLCARFLKSRDESRHGRIYRFSESAFKWLHYEYNVGAAVGAAPSMAHARRGGWRGVPECLPLHHRAQRASSRSRTRDGWADGPWPRRTSASMR